MNKRNGFTVIELLVVIAFLIAVAVLGFFQLSKIRDESDNTKKRTAINAMYYSLEEGFYAKNGYYPSERLPLRSGKLQQWQMQIL